MITLKLQMLKVVVNEENKVNIVADIKYTGIQYDNMVEIEKIPIEKTKELYKSRFSNLNQLI